MEKLINALVDYVKALTQSKEQEALVHFHTARIMQRNVAFMDNCNKLTSYVIDKAKPLLPKVNILMDKLVTEADKQMDELIKELN